MKKSTWQIWALFIHLCFVVGCMQSPSTVEAYGAHGLGNLAKCRMFGHMALCCGSACVQVGPLTASPAQALCMDLFVQDDAIIAGKHACPRWQQLAHRQAELREVCER